MSVSTTTAPQHSLGRRRLAAVLLTAALAGGTGAALPAGEAQAQKRQETTCWYYGEFEQDGTWYVGWFEESCG